jgi:hypothetical protein
LDEINAAEELPSSIGGEKRTSVCFFSIGITAGTIGGTAPIGMKTTPTAPALKGMDEEKAKSEVEDEEEEEEAVGDEFI